MRTAIGAMLMALAGAAAQPAAADAGASPADRSVSFATLAAALPSALAVPAATAGLAPATGAPALFRLAPLSLPAIAATTRAVTTDLPAGVHRRFTGTMTEFYPFAGSGFHLSGGTRLFARRNFIAETEASARGALAVNRVGMASGAVRPGFRRFNPVATAGYTMPLTGMAQLGVEAGMMAGRAFTGTPGLPRGGAGFRGDNAFHPDAIANLVFGMRF